MTTATGYICFDGSPDWASETDWERAWLLEPRRVHDALIELYADKLHLDGDKPGSGGLSTYGLMSDIGGIWEAGERALGLATGRRREIVRRWMDRAGRVCEGPGDAWRAWLQARRVFLSDAQWRKEMREQSAEREAKRGRDRRVCDDY